jgi:geranylgeranylglycerol-phosphate geranylgeranyltransferase
MTSLTVQRKRKQYICEIPISFAKSQLVLFQSRKKFAFLYCLATVTGLFCIPGVLGELSLPNPNFLVIVQMTLPLPIASLLVTAGTYIMNDLIDADLDRANGKKRPISSGQVSKKQAWSFVGLTFGISLLLTGITSRPISLVIISLMLVIGITYSLPRIALMKRFVIKTVSIALFYMLCALLGITSTYNLDIAIESPMVVAGVLLPLALMVFISSILNDMGDVDGDRAAGRRTIPIVIGKANAIKLAMILGASVLVVMWAFCGVAIVAGKGSPVTAFTTTPIVLVVMMTLSRMCKGFQNAEFMRSQHKKLFPLQLAMHPSFIIGFMML